MGHSGEERARGVFAFLDILTGLLGVGLLVVGLYLNLGQQFGQVGYPGYRVLCLLQGMIVLGGAIVFLCLLGPLGAACRSYCTLVAYVTLFTFIVAAQIALLLTAVFLKAKVELLVEGALDEVMLKHRVGKVSAPLDFVQSKLGCCGVRGWVDYHYTQSLPLSCCATIKHVTNCTTPLLYHASVPGCRTRLMTVLYDSITPLALCIVFILLEVMSIVVAIRLSRYVRRKRGSANWIDNSNALKMDEDYL